MQAIRQSLAAAVQRRVTLVRPAVLSQQVRFDGSDPRSSTSSENHKIGGSDLNKSKGSGKKPKQSTTVDDTKQPGVSRKDWANPSQLGNNDPPYGKAGGSTDTRDPERGKH